MRDFQVSRVYNWDWMLRSLPQNWKLVTVGECQVLVEKIWIREGQHPHDVPIVTDGRGRTSAGSKRGEIAIPRKMRQSCLLYTSPSPRD